jgi:hypothetical protein
MRQVLKTDPFQKTDPFHNVGPLFFSDQNLLLEFEPEFETDQYRSVETDPFHNVTKN